MENYKNKVKQYITKETLEPDNSQEYIKGLNQALVFGESCTTKEQLVLGLTADVLQEMNEKEPKYLYIRALVSALKEALKEDGVLELPKYKVVTPVHQIVRDSKGRSIPLKFVEGDYQDLWTMPEILVSDITYVAFAQEV